MKTKKEILIAARAKYNTLLFTIKSPKRQKIVQDWLNDINSKILKLEESA